MPAHVPSSPCVRCGSRHATLTKLGDGKTVIATCSSCGVRMSIPGITDGRGGSSSEDLDDIVDELTRRLPGKEPPAQ